jgi:hypothetical protein
MPVPFGCTELREIEVLGLDDGERTLVGAKCEERCARTYWQRVISLRIPNRATGSAERREMPADTTPQKVLQCILSALAPSGQGGPNAAGGASGTHAGASLGLRLQCTAPSRAEIDRARANRARA